jgi:hypothetical protein
MHAGGMLVICLSATHALVNKQQLSPGFKSYPCAGLNGSQLVAAAFDPARVHRAYGVSDAGRLVILNVPHERKMGGCKVNVLGSVALLVHALHMLVLSGVAERCFSRH